MIKAIETRYAGCRFRSRLEARWAVFFTTLHIPWEYEPQGFMINGTPYLPDFYLPQQKLWVEIKPGPAAELDPTGNEKWNAFSRRIEFIGCRAAIFEGNIPAPTEHRWRDNDRGLRISTHDDQDYAWCACRTGQHFDIQFEGRSARIKCGCPGYEPGGRGHDAYGFLIEEAYAAARSARFEHGESGA